MSGMSAHTGRNLQNSYLTTQLSSLLFYCSAVTGLKSNIHIAVAKHSALIQSSSGHKIGDQ